MADIGTLLTEYGYLLVVSFILFEQLGLPLPATPVMLAVGAYARTSDLSLPLLIGSGVVACVSADWVWYTLGRKYGGRLVRFLCRLTLEPDDCSRRSGDLYHRYGVLALVTAKFVPGLNTVAAPLAGVLRLKRHRFLLWDTAGATLWISTMLSTGYLFSNQVEAIGGWLSRMGAGAVAVLLLFFAVYLGLKLWVRRRFVMSYAPRGSHHRRFGNGCALGKQSPLWTCGMAERWRWWGPKYRGRSRSFQQTSAQRQARSPRTVR